MSRNASIVGYIVFVLIYIFGTFCCFDLIRQYNITSKVIGYFQHTTDVVKITDFEYDITSLLFTSSGAKENEYFAEVKTSPVEGFDKTKNYTILINDTKATNVKGEFSYINVEFMNTFNSTQDTELLTDILNIKINFFTDGTRIVFVTKNGEQAVKLWSSFIQKNGFKLKIVEDNFKSEIEADNIPEYAINLYVEDNLIDSLRFNFKTYDLLQLPKIINGRKVLYWKDLENNIYYKIPYKNINLYAVLDDVINTTFELTKEYQHSYEEIFEDLTGDLGDGSTWNMIRTGVIHGKSILNNEKQQAVFDYLNQNKSGLSVKSLGFNMQIGDFSFHSGELDKNSVGYDTHLIGETYAQDIVFSSFVRAWYVDSETNTITILQFTITIVQDDLSHHHIRLEFVEGSKKVDESNFKTAAVIQQLSKNKYEELSSTITKNINNEVCNISFTLDIENV